MEYPKVNYSHLPCALVEGQHYIGERPELVEKELDNYLAECWPLKYESYHCKGYSVHGKINNGHYIKAAVRYYKNRHKLRTDRRHCFVSAYQNLVVFNDIGQIVPIEQQKYEQ